MMRTCSVLDRYEACLGIVESTVGARCPIGILANRVQNRSGKRSKPQETMRYLQYRWRALIDRTDALDLPGMVSGKKQTTWLRRPPSRLAAPRKSTRTICIANSKNLF